VFKSKTTREWYGKVVSANGNELLRTSEGYRNREDCEQALKSAAVITIKALFCAALLFATPAVAQTSPWLKFEPPADAKSLLFAAYPGYAPTLTVDGKKAPWGFGAALMYPVLTLGNVTGYTGGRVDYLARDWFSPSVDVGLKAAVRLFDKVTVHPFAEGGAIVPLAGAGDQNGSVGSILGGGAAVGLFRYKTATLSAFYAYEHWWLRNQDVGVHRPGLVLNVPF